MTAGGERPALDLARRPRVLDRIVDVLVHVVAFASIAAVLLILVFVGKAALPLFTSAEVREEVTVGDLFHPSEDRRAWQPVSTHPKYAVLPLVLGSLKVTAIAMVVAGPLAVLAAIFVAEYAPRRIRKILKPAIELLAGVPSVVIGFFALVVLGTLVQKAFGFEHRLNAVVAGLGLAFVVCPLVFTIAEDALRAVPESYRSAAHALGSTRSQTILRVVLPAASPGIVAALVLGLGRAIGETMIVLLASGNAPLADLGVGRSTRTITATVAQELGEVVVGSPHYTVLFALGVLLFLTTFAINLAAERVIDRMRRTLGAR